MLRTAEDSAPGPVTRAADAATLALILFAAWVLVHPIHGEILGIPIQAKRWWRLLEIAAGIAVVRHWLVPSPSLATRVSRGCEWTRPAWPALGAAVPVALGTRLMVLALGYFSVVTFGLSPSAPPNMGQIFGAQLPLRWDGGWYLGIVHHGYDWTPNLHAQQNLNFFPAYPLLVRAMTWVIHLTSVPPSAVEAWVGTIVSIIAFVLACVYLYYLVEARFGRDIAGGTVLLAATYPFALFYSAVYPEALFLLCAVAAWYHLERDQLLAAVVWGIVAGLSRPNGGMLTAALGVWVLLYRRRRWASYAAAAGPIIGTAIYSAWAYRVTGHPLVWVELQRTAFQRTYEGLDQTVWQPLVAIYQGGTANFVQSAPWDFVNLLAVLLCLGALWPVFRRVDIPDGVFVAINVLVPLFNGGLTSMGRYTAVLFPMFIWMALRVRGQNRAVLAVCFALCQGVLAALFFTWRPIF